MVKLAQWTVPFKAFCLNVLRSVTFSHPIALYVTKFANKDLIHAFTVVNLMFTTPHNGGTNRLRVHVYTIAKSLPACFYWGLFLKLV